MIKKILEYYKNLEKLTFKILKRGLKFCFTLCILSICILLSYATIFAIPFLFHIGLSLFRLSIVFSIEFLVCALVVDSIKKQAI